MYSMGRFHRKAFWGFIMKMHKQNTSKNPFIIMKIMGFICFSNKQMHK